MSERSPTTVPAFPAVKGDRYHVNLNQLRGIDASGVYAIIDRRNKQTLYVGESHSGRLFDTITRHFRKWTMRPGDDAQGRRRGGTTYDRGAVLVTFTLTPADQAMDFQFAEIQRLQPRDNSIDGATVCCDDLPI